MTNKYLNNVECLNVNVIQFNLKVGNKPSFKMISCQYFDVGGSFKDPILVVWNISNMNQVQTYTRYVLLTWMDERYTRM
jgi:hypothetical protein